MTKLNIPYVDIEPITDISELECIAQRQVDVKIIGLIKGLLKNVATLRSEVDSLKVENASLKAGLGQGLDKINANSVDIGRIEQYSRRGTLTVIGLPMVDNEDVVSKVIETLSTKDVKLVPGDFEAVHRNGNKNTEYVRPRDQKKFVNPPSITVRFGNLTKKDKVQRAYKNYNSDRKPKQVRVYQSLTPYYKTLKDNITKYLEGLKVDVKWIHWRSATAGMVVKLDGGRLLTKLFCLNDCKSAYTGKPVDQIVESERSERS